MAFMRRVKQRFSLENLPWASSGRAKAGGDDSEDVSGMHSFTALSGTYFRTRGIPSDTCLGWLSI